MLTVIANPLSTIGSLSEYFLGALDLNSIPINLCSLSIVSHDFAHLTAFNDHN